MTTSSAESPQAITADARRSPRKRRSPFWTLLSLLLVLGVGLSAAGFKRYHLKRLEAVRKDVLYRCAQPTEWGLRYLINHCAVKTIVSLQLFDSQLYRGCLDPWGPSGVKESQFVPSLGARLVQWPMGEEACWPWPTPWQLEAFLGLMDDPENLPVAVHCQGGRHRTGTVTAIYRMEYDRWPADRAIAEMHSFDFPEIVPIQEHNLRTYLPRPRPDAQTWATMAKAFESVMDAPLPSTYEQFVRSLRRIAQRHSVQERVSNYLERQQPFALPLAARLIDEPDDPLVRPTMIAALKTLRSFLATRGDWQMAASVIADFGSPENQRELFAALSQGAREATVSVRYAALVEGVTNRYTENRIPYLLALLEDERLRPEPAAERYRFCDTAVARLQSITDIAFLPRRVDPLIWAEGRVAARTWLTDHPKLATPGRLVPPAGEKFVRTGAGTGQEDLSRLR